MRNKKLINSLLLVSLILIVALTPVFAAKNVVVIGMLGDNETLNPILSESSTESQVMNSIFSTLIKMNDKLQMVPDLLVKLPTVSKDNLIYTFQLRKGVKFHDGVELTSADIKFLYEMKMAKGNEVPSREMWEKIKDFKTVDKYNFQITLTKPSAPWLEGWCYEYIAPKHILEKEYKAGGNALTKGGAFSRKPIGTGPYKFAEWKSDQYTMVKKNPNYFKKGLPKIDTVVFKIIPDTNGLLAQFKNGDINVFYGAQPSQYNELAALAKKKNIKLMKNPAFIYMHADFNFKNPIFQDKKVRQALCYAFPKDNFIKTVLEGIGTAADSNIVPMSWAYNPKVKKYNYSIETAKKLLDEAGWKVGTDGIREKDGKKFAFTLSTNAGNKTREKFEEIAQQEWAKLGAKVEIRNYEAATFFGDILDNAKFDIAIFAWVSGADPDCYSLWSSKQIPFENNGQGQNYVSYKNARIDTLVDAGQTELNQAKRKQIYGEIQAILAEEVPYMFVYYYQNITAIDGKLQNYKPNATQATDFWNIGEWAWK